MDFEIRYDLSRGHELRKIYLQALQLSLTAFLLMMVLFLIEAIWNSATEVRDVGNGTRNLRLALIVMILSPITFTLYGRRKTLRWFRQLPTMSVTFHFTNDSIQIASPHGTGTFHWSFVFDVKRKRSYYVLRTLDGDIKIPISALTAEQANIVRQRILSEQEAAA